MLPRLRRGPEQPFAAQVSGDLFVRNDAIRLDVCQASTDRLDDVQVIQHVVQAAIVWETVKKSSNGIFDGHESEKSGRFEYTTEFPAGQIVDAEC